MIGLAAAAAAADDPWSAVTREPIAEEWGDGLTLRPVRSSGGVASAVAAVGGPLQPVFGDVSLQLGAPIDAGLAFGGALDARVVHAPLATGPATGLQAVGGELWLTVEADGSRHGLGLVYAEPTGAVGGWYLYHPVEGGRRVVGVYDATFDLGRFDVLLDLRLGGGTPFAVQLGGTLGTTFELERHVALTAAFQAAFAPTATLRVGVDVRPVDHVELDLGVGVPTRLDDGATSEVQPGLSVKLWR